MLVLITSLFFPNSFAGVRYAPNRINPEFTLLFDKKGGYIAGMAIPFVEFLVSRCKIQQTFA